MDSSATTLTGNSVSVNAAPWGGGGGGGGSPRFTHQHSVSAAKLKAGGVITNSVMEQLRPPDTGGGAGAGMGVVTAASGAVTVINVGASSADSAHPDDGKNIKYYQTCNGRGMMPEHSGGLRGCVIEEEEDEGSGSGSDGEVSKIDFTGGVNLRHKKKRGGGGGGESRPEEPERPMSWEGELSDAEMSVDTGSLDNKLDREETSMEGVQICGVNNINNLSVLRNHDDSKHPVKFREGMVDKVLEHVRSNQFHPPTPASELPLLVDKLLGSTGGGGCYITTPSHSPVLQPRHHPLHLKHSIPPTPSPDSAIHSAYSYSSPAQSPVTSRHGSAYCTPSLSRNNSDASQYGGSQHSSCYSYSSVSVSPTQFSPTHSPIQSRHIHAGFPSPVMARGSDCSPLHIMGANGHVYGGPRGPLGSVDEALLLDGASTDTNDDRDGGEDKLSSLSGDMGQHSALAPPGISRQQLINSPCPICGDKISGFHYGIFSCESCKGFFKRTVQNRKNYVCLRGSSCPVTIATRKKCPACRFDKCLKMGMKLEAIREDRTRGGRSTYQCSYTLPASLVAPPGGDKLHHAPSGDPHVKLEAPDLGAVAGGSGSGGGDHRHSDKIAVPQLLQEIMDVEHLWHYNESEAQKMSSAHGNSSSTQHGNSSNGGGGHQSNGGGGHQSNGSGSHQSNGGGGHHSNGSGPSNGNSSRVPSNSPDFLSNLCNIADHRLYRLVKWCKSLPLFKNISIDDQISLLINAWCELLLFSCCFRSMCSPGEIRVSLGKSISLAQARDLGLGACIERMLNFTEHLRRLRVDKYEYVAMKVIVLLTSDANDLRECEKVRASQEKALEALQHYTLAHYPDIPSKFGELLLRIPELQRTCQVGKEMLSIKNKEGEGPSFNLLMELLRGDH